MIKIVIIGNGNVAVHLQKAFKNSAEVVMVNSRTLESLPLDSDFYIIAVKDDAISEVVSRMPEVYGIVCHTSGCMDMEVLAGRFRNYGVFYPLQTFSKGKAIDYASIPVFVEGCDDMVVQALKELSQCFTTTVFEADSLRRRRLHVASVFACNYVNVMWDIASGILAEDSLPFEILLPLINETVKKVNVMPPDKAQTGPAVRKDIKTIDLHLEFLSDRPAESDIYRLLSEEIIKRH